MITSVVKIRNDGVLRSYKMTLSSGQIWFVPLNDESNTDYQMIQEWVAEGNTIEEGDS
tara:strand:+ start:1188 stop:1361 length:174 start_codon:yes stop_codon:yes gene_type:complete